jgi:hypothetical protein
MAATSLPTTTASLSPPLPTAPATEGRTDAALDLPHPAAESPSNPQPLATASSSPTTPFAAANARPASSGRPGVDTLLPSQVGLAPVTETMAGSLTVSCSSQSSPPRDTEATKVVAAGNEQEEIRASEDEHPRDPLFREFGKELSANDTERRQHPRPTNASTKPITLGLRPRN